VIEAPGAQGQHVAYMHNIQADLPVLPVLGPLLIGDTDAEFSSIDRWLLFFFFFPFFFFFDC